MRFFIVDAFTEEPFGGNAAGVVLIPEGADFPPDGIMRKTAAELRYSETAFVKRRGDAGFQTRYFTPAAEVDLCGHATIAAFHALAESGLITGEGTCVNSTQAGALNIEIKDGTVWMDMAAPEYVSRIDKDDELDELYSIMGLDARADRPAELSRSRSGDAHGAGFTAVDRELFPEIISTGLPDIILPVVSADRLNAVEPDFQALTELSEKYSVVGVHAFSLPGDEPRDGLKPAYHCRNFAPLYGIDEEAATGTANGALTYYLYRRGAVTSGELNVFIQGASMGRPSRVMTMLSMGVADDIQSPPSSTSKSAPAVAIRVGGRAAILISGEILL
jgi:predicted PhzF superfamily epimerase YddE/YHI9